MVNCHGSLSSSRGQRGVGIVKHKVEECKIGDICIITGISLMLNGKVLLFQLVESTLVSI